MANELANRIKDRLLEIAKNNPDTSFDVDDLVNQMSLKRHDRSLIMKVIWQLIDDYELSLTDDRQIAIGRPIDQPKTNHKPRKQKISELEDSSSLIKRNKDTRLYKMRSKRKTPEIRDSRTAYQRDKDRLIHAPELRRLAGVTQVVNAIEGHTFHNRLTHTLKVAQIARRFAEEVLRNSNNKHIQQLGGLNPDVAEAAALAHDLGHPPFGHIGEKELDKLVREKGNKDGYEGNAQTFRIITKLSARRERIPGLNLTLATRRAVLKYPWLRSIGKQKKQKGEIRETKWGAYSTEVPELNEALELTSRFIDDRMSLEAAIMDLADDIAYAIHDLEDFYKAGLIPLFTLTSDQTEYEREVLLTSVIESRRRNYSEIQVKRVFNRFMNLLHMDPYRGELAQKKHLRMVFSNLIGDYMRSTRVNKQSIKELNTPVLKLDDDGEKLLEIKILKDITHYYVINSRKLRTIQAGHKKIIRDLFNIFYDAIAFNGDKKVFPADFDELLKDAKKDRNESNANLSDEALYARVCADLISRMTDHEAIHMHQRLTGIGLASIYDYIPD